MPTGDETTTAMAAAETTARRIRSHGSGRIGARAAVSLLGNVSARQRLLDLLAASVVENGPIRLVHRGSNVHEKPDLSGLELKIAASGRHVVLDIALNSAEQVQRLSHPLAPLFPSPSNGGSTVQTRHWPGSTFAYVDPGLVGPRFKDRQETGEGSLLGYLGRVVSKEPDDDGLGVRFVEPGVGRSLLVDFLRIDGRPEFREFSITGVGLTPYSEYGRPFLIGAHVDGRLSLEKAAHRQQIAQRLEAAGCRVPATAAVIVLPGLNKVHADGRREQAALLVRGFRIALRVQQLDPLHAFQLSNPHRSLVTRHVLQALDGHTDDLTRDDELQHEIERLTGRFRCMREIVLGNGRQVAAARQARELRRRAICSYAPVLLGVAKDRLARELGIDPVTEPISDETYAVWFAESIGSQLRRMRELAFLFDYRMARHDWNCNTLHESQVSLLAEFNDLETGIFMDCRDLDGVFLTRAQFCMLRRRYDEAHACDVAEARRVVELLALIASRGDSRVVRLALETFGRSYERESRIISACRRRGRPDGDLVSLATGVIDDSEDNDVATLFREARWAPLSASTDMLDEPSGPDGPPRCGSRRHP